jgi:hypothetical protein
MSERHLSQELLTLEGGEKSGFFAFGEKGVGYLFTVFVKRYPTPFSPRALQG